MAPEEEVVNPSSLTKFRKLRLKDTNLLDLLIGKTVEIAIKKKIIKLLKETSEDDLEELALSKDADAKVGHKTADTSFFGYKTHIAMTEERIITAAVATSGEKHDGKQLKSLIEKSEASGIEIENVIGDAAYSEKDNIEYIKKMKKI